MNTDQLKIPERLSELVRIGYWPASDEEERKQNIDLIVDRDLLSKLAPDEEWLYLHRPPFRSIDSSIESGNDFWLMREAAASQLDTAQAIIIADFGLGSDSPIVLQYKSHSDSPKVMRLKWFEDDPKSGNQWVELASSFEMFCDSLGMPSGG